MVTDCTQRPRYRNETVHANIENIRIIIEERRVDDSAEHHDGIIVLTAVSDLFHDFVGLRLTRQIC